MKRFAAFFLLIAIMLSVVPVSAATSGSTVSASEVLYDTASVDQWNAYFSDPVFGNLTNSVKWAMLDTPVAAAGIGALSSYQALSSAENKFLHKHRDVVGNPAYLVIKVLIDGKAISPAIEYDESLGVHRLIDERSGLWIVSSSGTFPYFREIEIEEGSPNSSLGGKWVRIDKVSAYKNVVNEATLNDLVVGLVNSGESVKMEVFQNKYKGIQSKTRYENGIPFVYCDNQNRQYVMQLEPDEWAVNDSNNYYTDDDGDNVFDDGEPVEDQLINIENNTLTLPDGTLAFINNLIYDESTKTYYVDAHQEYDIDNNTYITNNYYYEYHINYTSITYIGQTEEYDEVYELYYQLPDGRNSADLTADELLALNTGIDVVPYIRSADTTALRSLYHFDANTRDSSYWNYCTAFNWVKGASLTYMDAGAFNGALYLDETDHEFKITLPSAPGISDFTLQFRMYHSNTIAPVTDSYITFGSTNVASFNGNSWSLVSSGGSVTSGPGSWSEVALIRNNGILYLYFNGVMVASESCSTNLAGEVTFTFGDEQQTYKYFDELRVLNYALVENGANYIPTAVPYDTNLALVLPDSTVPVADEYWSLNTEGNLFPFYDFTQYAEYGSLFRDRGTTVFRKQDSGDTDEKWTRGYLSSSDTAYKVDAFYDGSIWNFSSVSATAPYAPSGNYMPGIAFHFGIGYLNSNSRWLESLAGVEAGKTYTFSVMGIDGVVHSVTFTTPTACGTSSTNHVYTDLPDGSRIAYSAYGTSSSCDVCLSIYPPSNGTTQIVYMELIEGDTPNTGHELVSAIAPVADDFKTPTLAVKTDLDITGYQIGGVRPSLPEKGLVWALVEGGRITSLQIYNGQAWEQVDGRIWTGTRWVPYYAYDVLLLKDLYDIVEGDPSLDYIYTQEGFWAWLQQAWGQMMGKLDQIINALGGSTNDPTSDCPHVYDSKVGRAPSCSEPGHTIYTCSLCGHTYTELIDAHGHDWVVTNSVPDVLDEEGNMIEEGYDELTCSVCDAQSRDYGEGPEEIDLFDALGDFIADGITWILDRLTELADSLKTITETFNSFIEKVKGLAGGFPLFFGAFMALIPEDLQTIFWFAVIGFVVLAVWKKWSD